MAQGFLPRAIFISGGSLHGQFMVSCSNYSHFIAICGAPQNRAVMFVYIYFLSVIVIENSCATLLMP
jgi:hypothetical protein